MREGVLERAGWWLLMLGVVAGFLLLVLGGALPERAQSLALWIGMSLLLGGLAGALAWMAWGSPLEWRGISPAVSVLVGVLAGLAPFAWQHLRGGHGETSWKVATVSAAATPAVAQRRPAAGSVAVPGPAASGRVATNLPPAPERLDGVLADLGSLLEEKARPVVNGVLVVTVAVPRNAASNPAGFDSFRNRLTAASRGLAELQASLEQIKAAHPSFSGELATVLGGGRTPLDELNSELDSFGEAVASAAGSTEGQALSAGAAPAQLALKLRADVGAANRWVEECRRRIAEQRASVNSG